MGLQAVGSLLASFFVVVLAAHSCVWPEPPAGEPVPSLTLTYESSGAGEVTVTATPTDFIPDQVQFRIDAAYKAADVVDTTAPFEATFYTADHGPGEHFVHALGYDGTYFVGEDGTISLEQPNFVFVFVDDLDEIVMPYWDAMPNTEALVANGGLTFDEGFVVSPFCCPSRATVLTGNYAHNTGVFDNSGPDGGYAVFRDGGAENDTVATRLQAEGYETAFIGKYLNGYESDPALVPSGWDEWFGLSGWIFSGYGYTANHNGTSESYGFTSADYQTDVLRDVAVDFVDSTEAQDSKPFFLMVSTVAPHQNIPTAQRHQPNPFADLTLPMSPNFNEADVSDKPTWLRDGFPSATQEDIDEQTQWMRRGMGSMLAVDDLVASLESTLQANDELDDTVFVFMSDNGFNFLSHRLDHKMAPYEESLGVPFAMSGPTIRIGTESRYATNLDVAPTLLHLAGAGEQADMDGRSLVPLLRGDDPEWRTDFLVELNGTYFGAGENLHTLASVLEEIAENGRITRVPTYRALRTDQWLYVEWYWGDPHEYELYDIVADPHELDNLIATPAGQSQYAATTTALQARLDELKTCSGTTCRD